MTLTLFMRYRRGESRVRDTWAKMALCRAPSVPHASPASLPLFPSASALGLVTPQILCDQRQQVLHLERFREKAIGTRVLRHLLHVFMSRQKNNGNVLRGFLTFEMPTNPSPIGAGESDIQQQQIRERPLHLLHRVPIHLEFHCIPRLFEHQQQDIPDGWIILDDQYVFRNGPCLLLPLVCWVLTARATGQ